MGLTTGSLKDRITILRRVLGEDGAGQPLDNWLEHAKVWADVRHASGVKAITADAEVSVVRASIRIRQRPDITADMRVVHTARGLTTVYEIEAVPPTAAGQDYTDLICEVVR